MEKLAGLLGRERVLLELLLFKLVSLRQLLISGEVRFLMWASEEVDRAIEKVHEAESERSAQVEKLSGEWAGPLTLRALAETSPEPWRTIFAEHRRVYLELTSDLEVAVTAARRVAATGGAAVTATLDRLAGADSGAVPRQSAASATYGPGARWEPVAVGPRFIQTL
jgi:hypothetical protein